MANERILGYSSVDQFSQIATVILQDSETFQGFVVRLGQLQRTNGFGSSLESLFGGGGRQGTTVSNYEVYTWWLGCRLTRDIWTGPNIFDLLLILGLGGFFPLLTRGRVNAVWLFEGSPTFCRLFLFLQNWYEKGAFYLFFHPK